MDKDGKNGSSHRRGASVRRKGPNISSKASTDSTASKERPRLGDRGFEDKLIELTKKHTPKIAPDTVLLTASEAFFDQFNYATDAIRSYEQAFKAIARMLPTQFRTTEFGRTSNGDVVKIIFWYENVRYLPPNVITDSNRSLPPTPTEAVKSGQTYGCHMVADFRAELYLVESKEERQMGMKGEVYAFLGLQEGKDNGPPIVKKCKAEECSEKVHVVDALKTSLPIMVGSELCRLSSLRDTPIEAWALGEDPYNIGGYVILNGSPKTVGGVYSHTFNYPMSVFTTLEEQRVRSDIMTQKDPFFGNTHHLIPTIVRSKLKLEGKRKTEVYDIVIEITWNQPDMNEREKGMANERLSRIPIYALFCYYGTNGHEQMVNYIFPGISTSDERIQVLRDAVTRGPFHRDFVKTSSPITPDSSLLYIGKKILSPTAVNRFQREIEEDLESMVNELQLSQSDHEMAMRFLLDKKIKSRTKEILDGTFFFNVNHDPPKVCMSMGSVIAAMINIHVGKEEATDRNALGNLRIQSVGEQFSGEFKKEFKRSTIDPIIKRLNEHLFMNQTWEGMIKAFEFEITSIVKTAGKDLDTKMVSAFKNPVNAEKQQPRLLEEAFDPKNILFLWSKYREVTIRPASGEKRATVTWIRRRVHNSHVLMVCPTQTPEAGADVGRYHQPAIYATNSLCHSETPVRALLGMDDIAHPSILPGITDNLSLDQSLSDVKIEKKDTAKAMFGFSEKFPEHWKLVNFYVVLLNGTLVGTIPMGDSVNGMVNWLIEKRRREIHNEIGISVDHKKATIMISTNAGRLMTPLIPKRFILNEPSRRKMEAHYAHIKAAKAAGTYDGKGWQKLIQEGIIEPLDANMMDNATVAYSIEDLTKREKECTHVMLPDATAGIILSQMPAGDMTKAGRDLYACNHWKQGIGQTIHNPFTNYLTEMNLLRRAQVPLVRSVFNEIMGIDRYPFCENVTIGFMPLADNQADALIFNQGSVDRGMFNVHHITTKVFRPDKPTISFGFPDYSTLFAPAGDESAYRKVDPVLGVPTKIGTMIGKGDIIAAMTEPLSVTDESKGGKLRETVYTRSDLSKHLDADHCPDSRHPTYSKLTASYQSIGSNDRIRILQFLMNRYPKEGDKFSSENAQKGVCGAVWPESKIPMTKDGIRPDVIYNPPASIRRETYGQPRLAVIGKLCALLVTSLDHTPFLNEVDAEITKLLNHLGLDDHGMETMYNADTGEALQSPMMIGVLSYMRQRRMVDDLVSWRYNGAREMFSRQAVKGRERHGGVKFAEMEKDAALSSGAVNVVRDSMFTQAAPATTAICDRCSVLCYPSPKTPNLYRCDRCDLLDPAVIHSVKVPYNLQLISSITIGSGVELTTLTQSACIGP